MSKAVQRRRGTTAEHSTFTGLLAELTVDTTKKTAVIHDGVTIGGFPLARDTVATQSLDGLLSSADKTKIDGVANGAEVNQNAFSIVAVNGQANVESDAKTDTLTLVSGTNITITTDAATDSITINSNIPNLDANKITSGIIDIARLPATVLERMTTVADQTARFALTTELVQNGDSVKQLSPNETLYMIVDDTKLDSEAGYQVYKAGSAASVPWAGVTDKPTTDGITEGSTNLYFTSSRAIAATLGSNTVVIGDGADTDKILQANTGAINKPALKYNTTSDKWEYSNDGSVFAEMGSGGSSGGSNLALLAHSNQISSNTDTDYSTVATASVFASALRFKREAMKFYYIEKGNGNCQFIISDDTATVTAVGTNSNSGTNVIGTVEADCSTLAYGTWWTITVESKAVSGAYELRRINIMADPASPMTGNTIMLSEPNYPVNSVTPILVERKYYPTHYLIDADASISIDALVTVTSGTVTLRAVVTPVMDMAGTLTTPATSEEASASTDTTGNVSLLIPVPTILAPMIKIDVYMTGVGSLSKVCAWSEV